MKIYFASNLPSNLQAEIYDSFIKRFQVTHRHEEAEIVICGINPIDARIYKEAIYFVCPATNTDHIQYLNSYQKVVNIKQAEDLLPSIWSTAEHTMTLMCMLARKVFSKPNFWNRYEFVGTTLRNKKLAIIGYGRIGKQLEKIARDGFGMQVFPTDKKNNTKWGKMEALHNADFISINVSVTPKSRYALGRDDIAMIKKGAFLVNTSRGKAVDEQFLIENHEHFGGIALDVLNGEPNPPNFNKLIKLPNVIVTPHVSGCTIDDMKRTAEYCLRRLEGLVNYDNAAESQYHC